MMIRRLLLLCLITLSLGLTGPFARAFSTSVVQDPVAMAVTLAGAASATKTSTGAFKHCQRGAMAWSSCSTDLGYVPESLQIGMVEALRSFARRLPGTADDLQSARLFRPPRLN